MTRRRRIPGLAVVGAGSLLAMAVTGAAPAGAAPSVHAAAVTGAVPFSQATFTGYSSGHEAHVSALNLSSATQVAGITQAFSGASSTGATSNLSAPITGDDKGVPGSSLLVQPAQPTSVNAFGTGTGLTAGVGAAPDGSGNQVNQAGVSTQTASPDKAPVTMALPSAAGLNLPAGLVSASGLSSTAAAIFDPTSCPLGQPISYGTGSAANATALDFSGLAGSNNPLSPILGALPQLPSGLSLPTSGSLLATGNGVLESDSETFLSSNGDGTFGYTTQVREVIAPLTVNLFGVATLNVTVSGSATNPSATPGPVVFTATTTGESGGAKVTVASNDFIGVNITAGGTTTALLPPTSLQQLIGGGGLNLDLNPSTLASSLTSQLPSVLTGVAGTVPGAGSTLAGTISTITGALTPVLTTVGQAAGTATSALDVSFGTLSLGTPIRAINGAAGSAPTMVGGTQASGALDIANLHLGLSAPTGSTIPAASLSSLSDVADVTVGHFEAAAATAAPILCTLPVIKSANPTSVTAGGQFTYTILVPDPAKLADIDCSLANVSAVDTVTDYQGQPTFTVTAASNNGTIVNQPSQMSSTINWSGLSYALGSAPITLTVTVSTPSGSPAGVIQDLVNATGTLAGCTGGVSGIANLGNSNGTVLDGAFTLQAPTVTAAPATPATPTPAHPTATALPFTGGPGGLWQPVGGVAALIAGGGALWLLRRGRRLS